jgi:hypothetical protein
MRQAVDTPDDSDMQIEIARVVLGIANDRDYNVDTLFMLAIEKLRESTRKSG